MITWKRKLAGGLLSTLPLLAGPAQAQQPQPSEPPPSQQPVQQEQPAQQTTQQAPQDQPAQQPQPAQQSQQPVQQQPMQQQVSQQPPAQPVDLSNGHLDGLTASIALYPDALVSQILMAATYPDQVASAAQWSKEHSGTTGDAAVKAVANEPWDPSVQSLAAFPSVLDMMGRQPQWVEALGDAFLAAPDKVLDSVQRLRAQAQKAGSLKTTPQQKVSTQKVSTTGQDTKTVIVIEPANPQVVYVPTYNPTVVYGTWAYPTYPPVYYPPPPASPFFSGLVAGIGFGVGVAAVNSLWGGCNWGHGDVDINVNRYNNINPNRPINVNNNNFNTNRQVNVNNNNFNGNRQTNVNNNNFNGNRQTNVNNNNMTSWQHNPANRGSTPYQDSATRNKYDSSRQASLNTRPQAAGSMGSTQARPQAGNNAQRPAPNSRDAARERAAQSVETRTGVNVGHGATDARQGVNRSGQQGSAARGDGQQANGQRASGQRADGQQGNGQRTGAQQASGQRTDGQRGNTAGNTAGNQTRTQQRPATSPQERQRSDTNTARTQSRQANQQSALRDAGNGNATRQQAQRIDRTPQNHGGGRERGNAGRGRF